MTSVTEPPFPIWQGFRHSWTYNHRLNRLGDWVATKTRDGDGLTIEVGHTAASGSGRDEASFRSFRTVVRADGVHFREYTRSFEIRSEEAQSQAFAHEIRVGAEASIPANCDSFAAILSGFDVYSEIDSDKLLSFHLATTVPMRDSSTGDIVFQIFGALNVDCDSPECDLYSTTGGMIAAIAAGAAAGFNYGVPGAVMGALFGGLFTKLKLQTRYTLVVRVALIAGETDDFYTSPHIALNAYDWNKQDVVTRTNDGTVRSFEMAGDDDLRWQTSIPAITQLSLEVTRKRGILRPDTAMHLLELDLAVRPVTASGQSCTADIEAFFRNWRVEPSTYLDDQIDVLEEIGLLDNLSEDLASHRDVGGATVLMGLTLLQFAAAETPGQEISADSLVWGGGGASADSDAAIRRHIFDYVLDDPAKTPTSPPPDVNVHQIAVEHIL